MRVDAFGYCISTDGFCREADLKLLGTRHRKIPLTKYPNAGLYRHSRIEGSWGYEGRHYMISSQITKEDNG